MSDVEKSLRKLAQEEVMLKESIEAAQTRLKQIVLQRKELDEQKPIQAS